MDIEKVNYGKILTWLYDRESGMYLAEAKFKDGDETYPVVYEIEKMDGDNNWEWNLDNPTTKEFDWVGWTGLNFEDAIEDCEKHYIFHIYSKAEMFKHFIKHEIKAQESVMEMAKKGENAENSIKYWMAENAKSTLEWILKDIEQVESGEISTRHIQLLMTDLDGKLNQNQEE